MEVYFDNSATTRVYPEVADIMVKVMTEDYGNPSSLHMMGVRAENYIKETTKELTGVLKCRDDEIIYTSCGTESNNLAIIGTSLAKRRKGKSIITTSVEHASVRAVMEFLEKEGFDITYIDPDKNGKIDPKDVQNAITDDTILISCMMINNEIGAVQPVEEISRIIKNSKKDIVFHVDAIQSFGKIPVIPARIGADLVSVSGHKIHGPKGSGFLYVKKGTLLRPLLYGGGQQRNMRSGTENVPAIAGLGAAVKKTFEDFDAKTSHIRTVRDDFVKKVTSLTDVVSHSQDAPHIASIGFTGVRAEVMLHALEERGIYISSGSACSSNKKSVSRTLQSIGLSDAEIECTVRFSFGEENTIDEVDYAIGVILEILPILRHYTRG